MQFEPNDILKLLVISDSLIEWMCILLSTIIPLFHCRQLSLAELIRDSLIIIIVGFVVIQTSPDCDQYSALGSAFDFFVLLFSYIDCLKMNNIYATKVYACDLGQHFQDLGNSFLLYGQTLSRQITFFFPHSVKSIF